MSNDDWSFVQSYQALFQEGRLIATGWGQGGPSLIFHLLWGGFFTAIFGNSVTVLRVSVLFLAVVGTCGLLVFLKFLGLSRRESLLGALILTVNPLYLSLSFTYMTDVTFASLLILAVVAIAAAEKRASKWMFLAGLILCLAAILTRQIGLALPLGLLAATSICNYQFHMGRIQTTLWVVSVTILPWLVWEMILQGSGSTPVVRHEIITGIWDRLANKGLLQYGLSICTRFLILLSYVSFFLSPFWILKGGPYLQYPAIRKSLYVYIVLIVLLETGMIYHLIEPPVAFHRNVIINFGIGPLLFKDVYILGLPALMQIPPPFYYLLIFLSLPGALLIMFESIRFPLTFLNGHKNEKPEWLAVFLYFAALFYGFTILITGFHDRYLIPLVILLLGWLATLRNTMGIKAKTPFLQRAGSWIMLLSLGIFSITGTHDFVAVRRAAHKAHQFILSDLKVDPCKVDGGFEFNGYHCRFRVKEKKPGLSWWWVEDEDYLVSLNILPGYGIIRSYPIKRWLGADGEVYVLKPSHVISNLRVSGN
ncbi:MAG: hypothetical protein GY846_05375 [Deltaproteobacteria bacterium]|nr:hypothetical protein [Deltaproteobacteria bacterium]